MFSCNHTVFRSSNTGSHGGRGGSSAEQLLTNTDALPYGSYHEPSDPGSGGGGTGAGQGGGSISIIASGDIEIDGILSADGEDATSTGGGGAGGSIYINCDSMEGAGVISARGGKGSGTGGGGSGGRIAIHYSTQSFYGTTVADGGIAGQWTFLLILLFLSFFLSFFISFFLSFFISFFFFFFFFFIDILVFCNTNIGLCLDFVAEMKLHVVRLCRFEKLLKCFYNQFTPSIYL